MNDPFSEARQIFPNMPEEIFTLWLDGRIRSNGWPPINRIWQGTLRYHPLDFWTTLKWEKREVKLDIDKFTEPAKDIINGLIEAVYLNIPNVYSDPELDSKSKILSIIKYVKENKVLPTSPILLQEGDLFEIVDGSHRLAVFFVTHSKKNTKFLLAETQPVWVGFTP